MGATRNDPAKQCMFNAQASMAFVHSVGSPGTTYLEQIITLAPS
jgi:hypothetical protein